MPDLISLLNDCFKNKNTISLHKSDIWKLSICLPVPKGISYFFSSLINFSIEQYDQLLVLLVVSCYVFLSFNHFFIYLVLFWISAPINLQIKFIDIELRFPFVYYVKNCWKLVFDGYGYKRELLKIAETYGRLCSCKHISVDLFFLIIFLKFMWYDRREDWG